MANFWDRMKAFFGGADAASAYPHGVAVRDAMVRRAQRGEPFEAIEIAREVLGLSASTDDLAVVAQTVEDHFQRGVLKIYGYKRVTRNNTFVYNQELGQTAKQAAQQSSSLAFKVSAAMLAHAQRTSAFEAMHIAQELFGTNLPNPADVQEVSRLVEEHFQRGALNAFGYKRLFRDDSFLYNPLMGDPPGTASPSRVQTIAQRPTGIQAPPPARATTSRPSSPPIVTSYDANPEVLGLSAEEMRKRALKVNPYRTAWIGRVDTIPPQSDERTALIDRGLILRGLLSEQQIAEIHTIGDQWLRHRDASSLATKLAAKSADAAMEAEKQKKIAERAEKKRLAAERLAKRRLEIAQRKQTDILFLGAGVSSGLNDRRSNVEKLQAAALPILSSPADVAKAMGLTVPQLRWLCFSNEAAESVHYSHFAIPKRSGGQRLISAPKKKLATAQQWVLHEILEKLPTSAPAHGFIAGRSTVTNATEHVGQDFVVNLDLKDFFPSITFPRVRRLFAKLGYSPAVATVLAVLCTEFPRARVEYDGKALFVAAGPRALPQGACTSPAISNQIARALDHRLKGRLTKRGWKYTRYADDLTFSTTTAKRSDVAFVLGTVKHVAKEEGFALNPKKGRVQPRSARQLVTGIVVNQKLGVPRDVVRQLRAILHQAKTTGLEAQNREKRPNFRAWVEGMIAYVSMVSPEKGAKLKHQLQSIGA